VHFAATGDEFVYLKDLAPGETNGRGSDVYPGSACSSLGTLIAKDKAGVEIARREGRTCPGDTWVITVAAPSPSG
jgi:hypothetical protein